MTTDNMCLIVRARYGSQFDAVCLHKVTYKVLKEFEKLSNRVYKLAGVYRVSYELALPMTVLCIHTHKSDDAESLWETLTSIGFETYPADILATLIERGDIEEATCDKALASFTKTRFPEVSITAEYITGTVMGERVNLGSVHNALQERLEGWE